MDASGAVGREGEAAADLRRPMREYTTGMKRKLGIVQAFQSDLRGPSRLRGFARWKRGTLETR